MPRCWPRSTPSTATSASPKCRALDPFKRGAGDISFVASDVDGLVGLGPASSGDHTPRETVDIPSIFKQAKRAAILMSRLASERSGSTASDHFAAVLTSSGR